MMIKVNRNNFAPGWITLNDDDNFEFVETHIFGVNSFVYIEDLYVTRVNIPYVVIPFPFDMLPAGAEMLIGNERATRLGVPIKKQYGRNSIEENKN